MAYPPPVPTTSKPTPAFVGASWAALLLGVVTYAIGLWNADMQLSEKGFYGVLLVLGAYGAVSLQKSVRDREEGMPVSALYLGLSWGVVGFSIVMLAVGLVNSSMTLSEKGFYGLAFAMTLFAVIAVQKNVRDALQARQSPYVSGPGRDGGG